MHRLVRTNIIYKIIEMAFDIFTRSITTAPNSLLLLFVVTKYLKHASTDI